MKSIVSRQVISYVYYVTFMEKEGISKTDTLIFDVKKPKNPIYNEYLQKYGVKAIIDMRRRITTYEMSLDDFIKNSNQTGTTEAIIK